MTGAARIGLLCAALAAAPAARTQTLFIDDATLYTMGTPPVLQEADLLIRDGRIAAKGAGLDAPPDATVIDAEHRPVTPAFFAGITALGLEEISLEVTTADEALRPEQPQQEVTSRPEFDVTTAYNPNSTAIPVTRIEGYGWTVLGADRTASFIGGRGRAVKLDGGYDAFLGDWLLFVGIGEQTSAFTNQSRAAQFMLLQQAVDESQQPEGWIPEALLTRAGRSSVAYFRQGGRVVFDVHRAADILQVLKFAERNHWNAVISGGAEAWMVADTLAEAGVPVLLDPLLNLPGSFDTLGARLDNAAILHDAGVTVAFTAGGEAPHNARKLRQAAGVAVAYGLPHEAGVAGLTANPAAIFGLPDGYGTLLEGAPADLVLWSGDPLEVTTLAETVVLGGRRIPMVSRQTLLRDRYLPRNPPLPRAYIKP